MFDRMYVMYMIMALFAFLNIFDIMVCANDKVNRFC